MVNNFEVLKDLFELTDQHDFYYIQLLARRKDDSSLKTNSKFVYYYCYDTQTDWDNLKERIIKRCDQTGARAYVSINKRNYQRVSLEAMKLLSTYIVDGHYPAVKAIFTRAAGTCNSAIEKRWIIDIDEEEHKDRLLEICDFTNECQPVGRKIIKLYSTKNGYHIITKPFNMKMFSDKYPSISVFKDSSALLYAPTLE